MAELSEDDRHYISCFPLDPISARLQKALRSVVEDGSSNSPKKASLLGEEAGTDTTQTKDATDWRTTFNSLIVALENHQVAKRLHIKNTPEIYKALWSTPVQTTLFKPLIHAVVRQVSDVEVWEAYVHLVSSVSQNTSLPSTEPSSEQAKQQIEDTLRDELSDCSYVKVDGFFEKYFDGKSWSQTGKDIYQSVKHEHANGHWLKYPNPPAESDVWTWWSGFQDNHLQGSSGLYFRTTSKEDIRGVDSTGQLDLAVKSRNLLTSDTNAWADVRVVGEHTISRQNPQKFWRLARYARNIFKEQPRRRFLHGFILFGTTMELHLFDRSGTYCAEPFDIHNEPECFIRVLTGYCLMSDEELGLDTFIERDADKKLVTVAKASDENDIRLQLEDQYISRQAAISCRGTSCYRTKDHKYVVKFSWVPATRWLTEPELLKVAFESKVKGVTRLVGHCRITSTRELREGLVFRKKRQMISRRKKSAASYSRQLASSPSSNDPGVGKKRLASDSDQDSRSKKQCQQNISKLNQVYNAGDVTPNTSSTSQAPDQPFVDRVLSCLVISPAGNPLHTFATVRQFLQVMRDAIIAHRSLLLDGKILHRDISDNNIIITDLDENGGVAGMLIDMDLATFVDDEGKNARTDATRMTGTLKFMAIQVLELALCQDKRDLEQTYRHDLESFFYVFLSICINDGRSGARGPGLDPLQGWYIGSYEEIYNTKIGNMSRDGFMKILLPHFSSRFECVKELAITLRDVLFLRSEWLRIGTPTEAPSALYQQMIHAFDRAILTCG